MLGTDGQHSIIFLHGIACFAKPNSMRSCRDLGTRPTHVALTPSLAQTASKYGRRGLCHARCGRSGRSERKRRPCQATIAPARLRWRGRAFGLPSPHHASRALAAKEMPPHLMVEAWKKHSKQHVVEAGFRTWIGAIERKRPGFPAQPDHGAPFLIHCVLFGHEHANSPFT
jgi:hypothetical protein